MRIQFQDRRQATRFAAAVTNVTGREPLVSRSENYSWGVQPAGLNREWVCAISSLLESGVPSHQVTLEEVAERVKAEGWDLVSTRSERSARLPASGLLLGAARLAASRRTRPEEFAAQSH